MSSSALHRVLQETQDKVLAHENNDDPSAYAEAMAAIQALQLHVEKPGDYANRLRFQILENIAFVMLAHLGVVQAVVSKHDQPITAAELAELCQCDGTLIGTLETFHHACTQSRADCLAVRLMRVLTAIGVFDEVGPSTYQSTPRSEVLAEQGQIAGMMYLLRLHGRMGSEICQYLDRESDRKDQSALMFAFEGKSLWQLFDDDPPFRKIFNDYMNSARRGATNQAWHLRYPPCLDMAKKASEHRVEAVLMVDVGGGAGGQVGSFRNQFPDIPGRCILQDLPETINKNPAPEGVEAMPYDFFTPQPIVGARIYLFRSVCHDWPDADCRKILGNTVAAMDPAESRLLLDEWVLSDTNVSLQAATLDVNMMLKFNAMERTETQWRELLESEGLEIVKIWRTEGSGESIIETKVRQ